MEHKADQQEMENFESAKAKEMEHKAQQGMEGFEMKAQAFSQNAKASLFSPLPGQEFLRQCANKNCGFIPPPKCLAEKRECQRLLDNMKPQQMQQMMEDFKMKAKEMERKAHQGMEEFKTKAKAFSQNSQHLQNLQWLRMCANRDCSRQITSPSVCEESKRKCQRTLAMVEADIKNGH
jgi:hypothetical protein